MSLLTENTATITRYAPGAYVNGRWVDGESTTLTIRGSIQPARGRDLRRLPEGQRVSGAVAIYTATTLRTASEASDAGGASRADVLHWQGRDWEVSVVDVWGSGRAAHCYAVAVLIEPEPDEDPDEES